jgi:hypothetical protein
MAEKMPPPPTGKYLKKPWRDYIVKLSYSGGVMANRDTSRVSGNTHRGILYISRRKHFENYIIILFQHAHRICMIIV